MNRADDLMKRAIGIMERADGIINRATGIMMRAILKMYRTDDIMKRAIGIIKRPIENQYDKYLYLKLSYRNETPPPRCFETLLYFIGIILGFCGKS